MSEENLDSIYGARLIRVFLGASNPNRRDSPFTGFEESDNIRMHDLWPRSPLPSASRHPRNALFHVVNMALSLVHGDRLGWQEQKAHSFTVSPLHAGSVALGAFRRTCSNSGSPWRHYGGRNGMSLGTAVTISGARTSRTMGYRASQLLSFASTLLNPRLGYCLGNPGPAGENTFYLAGPRSLVRSILANAFGLMSVSSPYVYLSDGGQVDNLGLYEMVFRRCKFNERGYSIQRARRFEHLVHSPADIPFMVARA